MFSRFIHVVACNRIFFFKTEKYSIVCIYYIKKIGYPLMAFRLLLPLASAAVDMQLSLQDPVFIFFFFWMYKPKSLYIKTGSYADSIFKVLRSFRTVFYSVCTILQSHQLCSTIPVPLHPPSTYFFPFFW